ncbi:MAG TPA: amidohydrolase family protein, partial [Stellaceae bacterium]|nr:amidohydrolase family protein [Stellaceae bacterium]
MFDLVIRAGSVIDGTGAPRRIADVGVFEGKIAAIGAKLGPGRREVDAEGMLVTPGFVDIHTHYDGQATWDPWVTPSSWHGVTTAILGNCGVGFAPVRRGSESFLINLMEGVEDIPGTVLAEGVSFDWESFPDYIEALRAMPRVLDLGTQVPHGALRFYVMGDRGADHAARPNDAEIERMGVLLEEALHEGALGFTTSRTIKHRARDGRFTPSLSAREPELIRLALAMKRAGKGVIEVNSDFGPGEFETMRAAAEIAGRPLSCLLVQIDSAPERWRETMAGIHAARARGQAAHAQVSCRPIGVLMGLETSVNPFTTHPAWKALAHLSPKDRFARLKSDPTLRERLVTERPHDPATLKMAVTLTRTFLLDDTLDYEPAAEKSLPALARARGGDIWALALQHMMTEEGKGLLLNTFENYADNDLEVVREMMVDEASVMGVADGGAHVGVICDAGSPTFLLSHWARDRQRGARLPLEFLVGRQTRDTALAYGLTDRGV